MMNKRTFIKTFGLAGAAIAMRQSALASRIEAYSDITADRLASDEDFWSAVRGGYKLKPDYINLENGYYNIQPQEVLEAFLQHVRDVNYEGAYYMRTVQFSNKQAMVNKLAVLAGCSPQDLIITRNTTESLDMIIGGYPWQPGDEAVMAEQDYPAMLEMFKQVERRQGIVRKVISVPNHPVTDQELVSCYEAAIGAKTRLLMISHMINITGQILPVQQICDMAHRHGVEVMVDAAHSFAHILHRVADLHCDYYATSLHKWLSVPLGAGMLYVRPGLTEKIWPLLADPDTGSKGISRLNHTGTLPVHTDLAIADAIDYYHMLGAERKEARLRYLQTYWTSKVRGLPGIVLNTPAAAERACAIANVGIQGMSPAAMASRLLDQYKIYTVAIDYPQAGVLGCRITPNVFTLPEELDVLVRALQDMTKGRPA